jgi:hypothetical protein
VSHIEPIHVGHFEIRTICEGCAPLELSDALLLTGDLLHVPAQIARRDPVHP